MRRDIYGNVITHMTDFGVFGNYTKVYKIQSTNIPDLWSLCDLSGNWRYFCDAYYIYDKDRKWIYKVGLDDRIYDQEGNWMGDGQ
jgi:hypothetical protein